MRERERGELERAGRRISERRKALGWSQELLADRLGVSRQFIGALEAGRSWPSVPVALELARVLGTSVEALFDPQEAGEIVWGDPEVGATVGTRLRFARVDEHVVAYPLYGREAASSADGTISPAGRAEAFSPEWVEAADHTVAVAGCDPALTVLRDWVAHCGRPLRVATLPWGSEPSMQALIGGRVHVAGAHGTGNLPSLPGMQDEVGLPGGGSDAGSAEGHRGESRTPRSWVRIRFAAWEVGIAVLPGNPRGVKGLEDLFRPELRWVRRPAGTAVARLYARAAQGRREPVTWTAAAAEDHLRVAEMIFFGMADAGLTTSFAAHVFGLSFVPVEVHHFDLLLPRPRLREPLIGILLDVLRSGGFRQQMEALWGYDVSHLGDMDELKAGEERP
ncbi:substrate-binding domain-containing protein [Kyrpidia tusciae]|uniref:Transcriptional regulator of molybdate metabolism, XRE family n=1 Tax=Kyrpidia tusciae (strain DSM 2912 / NBRC 15312 / T2) TaxID=562970 RepID=D5WPX3_KYRT2|nr:substrate-binding domain-containing protein [Kyrpidia tusciae]ADG06382.1 transcriptional regulator of molybdate metabolism, XRE family [Kyrpidia tusciae DSM 2912]